MAAYTTDLTDLKAMPGFQPIMKSIVKSLMQTLVDQLTAFTDEECVIMTASVEESTISQLGSLSGHVFMQENEQLMTQFMGFCQKRLEAGSAVPNDNVNKVENTSQQKQAPKPTSKVPVTKKRPRGRPPTRKRTLKEMKNVFGRKPKLVATGNLFKRKKLKTATVTSSSSITDPTVQVIDEQREALDTEIVSETINNVNNVNIKQEFPETNIEDFTSDPDLASIVQSAATGGPMDLASLKLETADEVIEIQLANHVLDEVGDVTSVQMNVTNDQTNVSLDTSVASSSNQSTEKIIHSTPKPKKKEKSRAVYMRAYRQKLKEKDILAYREKERIGRRARFIPIHQLPQRLQEERRKKDRLRKRELRRKKKEELLHASLSNYEALNLLNLGND